MSLLVWSAELTSLRSSNLKFGPVVLENGDLSNFASRHPLRWQVTDKGTFRELARFLVGVCRKYRATCLRIQTEVP